MSEFGDNLGRTRTRSSFQFECRIPQMTHEDHKSGLYKCLDSVQFYVNYWEPNNMKWVDDRIRKDPKVAEEIRKKAPEDTEKWAFCTIEGVIACTDGLFVVNYFGLKEDHPQRGPGSPMIGGEHPFKKGGPYLSGPPKKY